MSSRSSIIGSIIIVVIVFSAVSGYVYLGRQYVPPDVAIVVNSPGFGDLSMADQVRAGLNDISGDLVVKYHYYTADDEADAQNILESLSASRIYELIVVVGGELSNELQTVAATHPNQRYAFIGGTIDATNIYSTTFAQHEAAYLAGALAATVSASNTNRTGIVGIIGSVQDDPTVQQLIAGFKQGWLHANSTLNLNYTISLLPEAYVGSYNDSDAAEFLAKNMFDPAGGNADIIFAPVRASILGIRNAMIYANETWFYDTKNREPFVIAAEGDQDYVGLPNIETRSGYSWVLSSVVPRSDLAVYRIINATMWDKFEGATLRYRINNNTNLPSSTLPIMHSMDDIGVNITLNPEFRNEEWVSNYAIETIASLRAQIFNGTITVSDTFP